MNASFRTFLVSASVLAIGTAMPSCAGAPAPAPSPTHPAASSLALPPVSSASLPAPIRTTLAAAGVDSDAMDRSADPCGDFFQFACGGWVAKTEIPADRSRWSRSFYEVADRNEQDLKRILDDAARSTSADALERKIGDYYAACMDEKAANSIGPAALKPLRDEIVKVKDAKTLSPVLAALHRKKAWAFFDVSSQQDKKDATKVIASLDQNGLGLPDRDYYLKDDAQLKDAREFYAGHVERMMGLLGVKPKEAKAAAADVVRIETRLAELSQSRVDRREPANVYHKVDHDGLVALAKTFPWDPYFAALKHPGWKDINVTSTSFFSGFDDMLAKEKLAAIRNYLTWTALRTYAPALSDPFVQEGFALSHKLSGQKEIEPRWKRCVRSTDASLGELLGQRFVARTFPAEAKTIADGMVRRVRDAFGGDLGTLGWMDGETRVAAAKKLEKMAFQIGYPERWREYNITPARDRYAANLMTARELDLDYDLDYVGKPADRNRWRMTPPTVNAYYSASLNQMMFPAGILQPPFFGKERAVAANFGAIGAVMGHELTHGFDDKGAKYDAEGNLRDWWSAATGGKFGDKTGCVIKQYGAYEPLPGQFLNGKLTTGENIADLGGTKLAFAAYRAARAGQAPIVADGFTEDQVFFLSFAQIWCDKMKPEEQAMRIKTDPHSPGRFRVIGTLSDTLPFAEAFKCKEGAPMKPATACSVW